MIQYLLNATAIWLLSLVIFDLFLRKETYHSYNRFYLIGTLLLGVFLPLWEWQNSIVIYGQGINQPLQKALQVKEDISNSGSGLQHNAIGWQTYLTYIYFAGVAMSIILFAVELIKLISLYNKGRKAKDGAWTIIETGKKHSPFSIFNYAFVESKDQYTAEQWNIILTHEQLHSMAFHFVDLLIVQAARIVFWFHPLVYLYQRRIMLLHEYQADKVSAVQVKQYGQFLIEQAMLQRAPAVSHSFNYSPVKSRIVMLTRKSSALAKSKLLLVVPLTLICLLLFTNNSFSAKFEKQGNIVKYRGNTIELSPPSIPDTVTVIDAVTGKQNMVVTRKNPNPIKLNGKKIYTSDDVNVKMKMGAPATNKADIDGGAIKEYLLSNMKNEIAKLDDGNYVLHLDNIVLDENGAIVYYEYNGITGAKPFAQAPPGQEGMNKAPKVSKAVANEFEKKTGILIDNAPRHGAAYFNGNAVPYLLNTIAFWNSFTVKNHKLVSL